MRLERGSNHDIPYSGELASWSTNLVLLLCFCNFPQSERMLSAYATLHVEKKKSVTANKQDRCNEKNKHKPTMIIDFFRRMDRPRHLYKALRAGTAWHSHSCRTGAMARTRHLPRARRPPVFQARCLRVLPCQHSYINPVPQNDGQGDLTFSPALVCKKRLLLRKVADQPSGHFICDCAIEEEANNLKTRGPMKM